MADQKTEVKPKRALCDKCARPLKVCICDALTELQASVDVIIWQDPTEAKHKLSTAPLLNLSIKNSRLLVGESFDFVDIFSDSAAGECALLYPLQDGEELQEGNKQQIKKLLILDGTWRKVRRLFHLNPWLAKLSYINLNPDFQSQYRIRKSPREDGLSTIEAGVAALSWLDNQQNYKPILSVLEKMVQIQEKNTPVNKPKTRK